MEGREGERNGKKGKGKELGRKRKGKERKEKGRERKGRGRFLSCLFVKKNLLLVLQLS